MNFRSLLLYLACLVMVGIVTATRADNLLAKETWGLYQPTDGGATLELLSAQAGSGKTLRITVHKPVTPFYSIGVVSPVPVAVAAGSRLRLRFRARSVTNNPVRAVVEKNGPPYTGVMDTTRTLTPQWKSYSLTGISPTYAPGELSVKFQVGQQAGEIELADISLDNLGLDPEIKAAAAALKPEAIQARIEKLRKGDLKIVAHDRRGRPIPGAQVTVEQTRHAFLFGCNMFSLDPANTEDWQKAYRERFTALFNYATLPFYWGAFEPDQGKPQYARLDAMTDWCIAQNLTPKGHPLVWQEVYPNWAPKTPHDAIPLLHERVTDIITHYKGRIVYWDVINEANNAAGYANGEGAWVKQDGAATVVQTVLAWAREAGKGATETYIYNDFNTGPQNTDLLAALQKRRALPDAVGIQSHMHAGNWPLEQVWQRATEFAKFGRPIHFTEVTVLSGPSRANVDLRRPPTDWVTTPEDEARQADYLEQFYTVLFSHPALRAITYWDFSDRGAWQNAPAGLLRKDMSPKPAYTRLMNLIHNKWWTKAEGTSDRSGTFKTRAFYGSYRITIKLPGGDVVQRTAELPLNSRETTYTLTEENR